MSSTSSSSPLVSVVAVAGRVDGTFAFLFSVFESVPFL